MFAAAPARTPPNARSDELLLTHPRLSVGHRLLTSRARARAPVASVLLGVPVTLSTAVVLPSLLSGTVERWRVRPANALRCEVVSWLRRCSVLGVKNFRLLYVGAER